MMMVEMIMTRPAPPSTFPRGKTQRLGFKMLLEIMKKKRQGTLVDWNYQMYAHFHLIAIKEA